jgi:3-methyladenine DNA glycosylase AlkD
LVERYKQKENKKEIYDFYLKNTKNINNWDLVDLTAPNIVGNFLLEKKKERKILYSLVKSSNLWERRISILSTFTLLRNKEYEDTLKLSKILLNDKHDLIHKAVGWMLREMGKRDLAVLEKFLNDVNYKKMPRTMLRYAIEKMPEKKRKAYLAS